MKYLGPMTSQQGLIGATLINAELIFKAGVRTLPMAGRRIGAVGKHEVQTLLKKQGPPASKPGQPPRKDEGSLHDSIEFSVLKNPKRGSGGKFTPSRGAVRVNIFSKIPYASELEFGTSKMTARPFFTPVFQNKQFAVGIQKTVIKLFVKAERLAAAKGGLRG